MIIEDDHGLIQLYNSGQLVSNYIEPAKQVRKRLKYDNPTKKETSFVRFAANGNKGAWKNESTFPGHFDTITGRRGVSSAETIFDEQYQTNAFYKYPIEVGGIPNLRNDMVNPKWQAGTLNRLGGTSGGVEALLNDASGPLPFANDSLEEIETNALSERKHEYYPLSNRYALEHLGENVVYAHVKTKLKRAEVAYMHADPNKRIRDMQMNQVLEKNSVGERAPSPGAVKAAFKGTGSGEGSGKKRGRIREFGGPGTGMPRMKVVKRPVKKVILGGLPTIDGGSVYSNTTTPYTQISSGTGEPSVVSERTSVNIQRNLDREALADVTPSINTQVGEGAVGVVRTPVNSDPTTGGENLPDVDNDDVPEDAVVESKSSSSSPEDTGVEDQSSSKSNKLQTPKAKRSSLRQKGEDPLSISKIKESEEYKEKAYGQTKTRRNLIAREIRDRLQEEFDKKNK